MNFYNPFKPHIVRAVDDTYMVRKIVFPHGAVYLEESVSGFYWWSLEEGVNKYCKHGTLAMALALLNSYKQATKTKRNVTYVPIK